MNSEKEVIYDTIAIIGVGLIGSSLARAAQQYGATTSVNLFDLNPAVRDEAHSLALGNVKPSLETACEDADLVILAMPVGAIKAAAQSCTAIMKSGAVLTDVGSVKGQPANDMLAAAQNGVHVIPGHPIAGAETSGPAAGVPELFEGRWTILTPFEDLDSDTTYAAAVDRLTRFWNRLGAMVELMPAERHDLVLSITSHLPHLIAFNIVATAKDMDEVADTEVVQFSAGGFRDFTRIASSDPTMWRDIFLSNREAVLESLGRFSEELAALQRAIRWGKGDELFEKFARARAIRQSIVDAGQDTDAPDFGRSSATSKQDLSED